MTTPTIPRRAQSVARPVPALVTVQGVYAVDNPPPVCCWCGASPARDTAMEAIGIAVYGLSCQWHLHTGVFRCSSLATPEAAADAELARSRITSQTRRFKPVPSEAFGDATMTRSEFTNGMTLEAMRDAWNNAAEA